MLLTYNSKHFQHIPGTQTLSPHVSDPLEHSWGQLWVNAKLSHGMCTYVTQYTFKTFVRKAYHSIASQLYNNCMNLHLLKHLRFTLPIPSATTLNRINFFCLAIDKHKTSKSSPIDISASAVLPTSQKPVLVVQQEAHFGFFWWAHRTKNDSVWWLYEQRYSSMIHPDSHIAAPSTDLLLPNNFHNHFGRQEFNAHY